MIIVAIGLSLVLIVIIFSSSKRKTTVTGSPTPTENYFSTPGASIYPVSLPALFTKKFDGRDLKTGRILAETTDYTRYAITYKSGQLTISGILQIPKKGTGPFPVVVTNHGYIDPAVYTIGRGLRREHDYLARHGYAVLHPDFRNHADSDKDPSVEETLRLGYVEDSVNAVYAIKSSDLRLLDKEKIGVMGHSMGGGVTLGMLVVQPSLVKAAVLYAPVSADVRENFRRWTLSRPEIVQSITERYGRPEENGVFWDNISPNTFFDRISVPILIHHGTNDESVPYSWSEKLITDLNSKGKDVSLKTYEGEVHEFVGQWDEFMESTVAFFDEHLKR